MVSHRWIGDCVFLWYLLSFKLDHGPVRLQSHTVEILLQGLLRPSSSAQGFGLGVASLVIYRGKERGRKGGERERKRENRGDGEMVKERN